MISPHILSSHRRSTGVPVGRTSRQFSLLDSERTRPSPDGQPVELNIPLDFTIIHTFSPRYTRDILQALSSVQQQLCQPPAITLKVSRMMSPWPLACLAGRDIKCRSGPDSNSVSRLVPVPMPEITTWLELCALLEGDGSKQRHMSHAIQQGNAYLVCYILCHSLSLVT
jgi:hypothetical protein